MKKLILTIAFGAACVPAFAQGYLNFANVGVGLNAPIYYPGNPGVFAAELYWGPAGTTDSSLLTAVGEPATFLTGAGAGYFTGGQRTIPGVRGGTTIVVQVRVWDTADGASWEAVVQSSSPTARWGYTLPIFNVTLSEPPAPPSNLIGLNYCVLSVLRPVPPRVLIDQVSHEGDSMRFHFRAVPPFSYTVEYSGSLTAGNWLPLASYSANLQLMEVVVTDSCTNAQARFFRVRAN